jgi:serine phosphatase RsbU (regulator of sigma subunit)
LVLVQPPSAICSDQHAEAGQGEGRSAALRGRAARLAASIDSHHSSPSRREAAEQVRGDDQRLEQQRHRQRAERTLHADDQEQQRHGHERLSAVLAVRTAQASNSR